MPDKHHQALKCLGSSGCLLHSYKFKLLKSCTSASMWLQRINQEGDYVFNPYSHFG